MSTIILYYSETGKTDIVAKTLAEKLNSDIIKIEDLNKKTGFLSKLNSSINAFRENKTEISPNNIDISEYDIIYIGTPTWASNPTPAIITLIDKLTLKNKDVILFTTLNNSGGESTLKRMSEKVRLRGGRVISEFEMKLREKTPEEIEQETLFMIENLDLNIYS